MCVCVCVCVNGNEKINRGFCQDSNPLLSKASSYIAVKEFNTSSARKVLRSESQDFSAHHYCSRGDASAGNSTHMMARAKYRHTAVAMATHFSLGLSTLCKIFYLLCYSEIPVKTTYYALHLRHYA